MTCVELTLVLTIAVGVVSGAWHGAARGWGSLLMGGAIGLGFAFIAAMLAFVGIGCLAALGSRFEQPTSGRQPTRTRRALTNFAGLCLMGVWLMIPLGAYYGVGWLVGVILRP